MRLQEVVQFYQGLLAGAGEGVRLIIEEATQGDAQRCGLIWCATAKCTSPLLGCLMLLRSSMRV